MLLEDWIAGEAHIIHLSAEPLIVVAHICRLACLEHPYILSLLAGLLLVGTYMSAGMLGAPIYFILFDWTAPSSPTYMLAGMHSAHMIISGPKRYMRPQDIISAEIGWNTIYRHLTH